MLLSAIPSAVAMMYLERLLRVLRYVPGKEQKEHKPQTIDWDNIEFSDSDRDKPYRLAKQHLRVKLRDESFMHLVVVAAMLAGKYHTDLAVGNKYFAKSVLYLRSKPSVCVLPQFWLSRLVAMDQVLSQPQCKRFVKRCFSH